MSFFTSSSMDKLGSRLASLVSSASEKVKEAAERTITKETPLEKNLREALSDKNWGCATSILSEIARASYSYSDCVSISKTMWDAIGEPPKRWRRIFKGLTMLEYMLKNGTEKFAEEARDRSYLLRTLQSFSWSEEGRDKGAGIREKAGICTTLVFDAAELKAAREEAAKNRDKYIGISSASSMACRSSSRGHTAATGLGSDSRYSSNRDPSSRNSRGEESTPRVADVPSSANKEKHRASGKKEGAKKSDAASPENSKASPVAKSRVQQADLLGFDSPPIGTQATSVEASSFASGNVWCEAPAAAGNLSLDSASNFEAFLPPPPPGAGAPSGAFPPAELPGAPRTTGDIGADDLFGCFQAASPPTTTGMSGSSNPLDAVAAAFAAPASPPATAGWTSATSTGGKGLGTSSLDALQGLQQLNTEPPTATPALFTLEKPSPTPDAAPQWQQPFTMGNSCNHDATNSNNAFPDPFSPWQQQAAAGSFASLEPGLF
ncbi:putative EPN3 protein [Cyclospora cayetanensis]|uniref:EPN3 protein n=1 Tax=Cyclospora cayetanensis TaxID=88456 RepID=A0A1D3DAD7_9EIME|nr:putative EPN3 protein [Cyclospora cayetanensis]